MSQEYVSIEFDEIRLNEDHMGAILFVIGGDECWLPRSQISELTDTEVEIPEWLAIERELV